QLGRASGVGEERLGSMVARHGKGRGAGQYGAIGPCGVASGAWVAAFGSHGECVRRAAAPVAGRGDFQKDVRRTRERSLRSFGNDDLFNLWATRGRWGGQRRTPNREHPNLYP